MPAEMPVSSTFSKLEQARPELEKLTAGALAAAWRETIDEFLDHDKHGALREAMAANGRLSRPGLDAGLDLVLRGVRTAAALDLFTTAREPDVAREAGAGPALVFLASNLPGLAVQSLLPALALRRPMLLKSPSSEPLFAQSLLKALTRRLPVIGRAYAAATWPGGARDIEDPLIALAGRVIAYGDAEAIADLESRAGDKLIAFGPKLSLAVIGRQALAGDLHDIAAGLARDVALFDQRGCLSVQWVITCGDALPLANALATALGSIAERWPMPRDAAATARQARDEAVMRGAEVLDLPIGVGTVVVEKDQRLRISPGHRFVRIYSVSELGRAAELLEPWRGHLQGVAIAAARSLQPALTELGVSRFASPGALQAADLGTWQNGGLSPLEAYL